MSEPLLLSENVFANNTLDAKDLLSPVPLLRAKKMIAKMTKGEVLKIEGTDPNSRNDFSSWCLRSQNEYLGEKREANTFCFYIKIMNP